MGVFYPLRRYKLIETTTYKILYPFTQEHDVTDRFPRKPLGDNTCNGVTGRTPLSDADREREADLFEAQEERAAIQAESEEAERQAQEGV